MFIPSINLTNFCHDRLKSTDSFSIPPIAVHEVGSLITNLKNKKAMGPDTLNASLLKLALPYIIESLTYIYNLCIEQNAFPSALKIAKIIPLPKSRDSSDLNNFRPISLLSVLSKPIEKHIEKHLMKYMEEHHLFHSFQSGFRQHHSCHTALINLCDSWLDSINQSKINGAIFLDFKKAFDLVNHNILLKKLEVYIQNHRLMSLFKSYLNNRTQSVYINGSCSTLSAIHCGVPQGSVLGPLLFCIFINDLPLHLTNKDVACDLFADDSTLHTSNANINVVQSSLQQGIYDVVDWCKVNHMVLHPGKTKCMVITSRQKHQIRPLNLHLSLCQKSIEQVSEHRVLGIIIDKELKWQAHINFVCKQLSRNLFLLSKLKHYVDVDTRKLFFQAHCLSRINYASTLWCNACDVHIKRMNSLHRRAAKLILPNPSLSTTEKLLTLNVLPLSHQFDYNTAILMYKLHLGKAAPYLHTFLRRATQRYGSVDYILPHVRIDLYKSSFAFSGPYVWNSLPCMIKTNLSLKSFKDKLRIHFLNKPTL